MSTDADIKTLHFKGSTNLREARHDPARNVVEVTFTNGTRYAYENFTADMLTEWGQAESAGKWFDANVKKNVAKHPPKRIEDAAKPPEPAAPATMPAPNNPTSMPPVPPPGVAPLTQDQMTDVAALQQQVRALSIENERLKRAAGDATKLAELDVEKRVLDRTKLEASETEKLRQENADLQAKLKRAGKFAPWRDRDQRRAESAERRDAERPHELETGPAPTHDGGERPTRTIESAKELQRKDAEAGR